MNAGYICIYQDRGTIPGRASLAMKNRIWTWFDNEFKAYCEKNQNYRQIMSWKGTRHGSTYFFPDGSVRYDVIIPRRLHNRVATLLGLPERVRVPAKRQETPSQVVVGQWGSDSTAISKRRLDGEDTYGKGILDDQGTNSGVKDWHRWVYGGARNPLLDVEPIPDRWKLPTRFSQR